MCLSTFEQRNAVEIIIHEDDIVHQYDHYITTITAGGEGKRRKGVEQSTPHHTEEEEAGDSASMSTQLLY